MSILTIKSLEIFENNSADKVWCKKDRGIKVSPLPCQIGLRNTTRFENIFHVYLMRQLQKYAIMRERFKKSQKTGDVIYGCPLWSRNLRTTCHFAKGPQQIHYAKINFDFEPSIKKCLLGCPIQPGFFDPFSFCIHA